MMAGSGFTGIDRFKRDMQDILGEATLLPQADRGMRIVALDLFEGTAENTAILSGALRASWQISRGTPDLSVVDLQPGESLSLAQIKGINSQEMQSLKADSRMSSIFITNNKPYALDIEYGKSKKAPRGMLRINLRRVIAKYGA